MPKTQNPPKPTLQVLKWLARQKYLPESVFFARLKATPGISLDIPTIITHGKKNPKEWNVGLEIRPQSDRIFRGQKVTNGWTLQNRQTVKQALAGYAAETGIILKNTDGLKFAGLVFMPNQIRGHAVVVVFAKAFERKPKGYRGTIVKVSQALRTIIKLPSEKLFLKLALDRLLDKPPRFVEYLKKY